MPFIRLSDNYIDHPKFLALSAPAFRLWHEGMAFCRKHQTDGAIATAEVQGFRYYRVAQVKELATPYKSGVHPLWEQVPSFGYQVHDYLFWNLSKEEEQDDRDGATERMRKLRARRKADRDASCSPPRDGEHVGERSPNVQDRIGSDLRKVSTPEKGSGEKPTPADAPARVLDAFRSHWKSLYGYECSLIIKPLEYMQLEMQVSAYTEAQLLAALAAYFATTDDYVRKAKHPLPMFLRDPLRYLATSTSAKMSTADMTREAAKLLGIDPEKAGIPRD